MIRFPFFCSFLNFQTKTFVFYQEIARIKIIRLSNAQGIFEHTTMLSFRANTKSLDLDRLIVAVLYTIMAVNMMYAIEVLHNTIGKRFEILDFLDALVPSCIRKYRILNIAN